MAEYSNENRGVLFKNDRKETDKHPDYRGNINVDGAEFWLDAWIKTSKKDGSKFMSLSIKPKEARAQSTPQPQQSAPAQARAFDDDIPF